MSVLTHLDAPRDGIVRGPVAAIHGWIAGDATMDFEQLSLINARGTIIPLAAVDRPDVRLANVGEVSSGFTGWIDIRDAAAGPWQLRYKQREMPASTVLGLIADAADAQRFVEAKARKLAFVRTLLRCPVCHAAFDDTANQLRCANGHTFAAGADAYDLLTDDVRIRTGAIATDNVSGHGYDDALRALIGASSGPILDVGAGLRPDYRDDVVNLEIVAYPTTDVVAAGECLPFGDGTFDLVISVATLEHVRDPFAAAREQSRVLRPGGRIFAAVPLLQPYHGYPDHYYNMTSAGLRNLFPELDVESLSVPASGHPIFALSWMLKSWRAGLPPDAANAFDQLRVADLAVDPMSLLTQDFVVQLAGAQQRELAALNVLVARKPA